ncbi:MAG TPA: DUF4440 domain-containing protein [Gemmatimonadales bacterium]|nr:DUF4440 domain-containing protein [Gemmatimonadales bacterium]
MIPRSVPSFVALVALAGACQRRPVPLTETQQGAIADSVRQADSKIWQSLNARDVGAMLGFYVPGNELISADAGMIYPSRDSLEKSTRAFFGSARTVLMVRDQQRIAVLAANAAVATEAWHGIVVDTSGRSMNLSGAYTAVWKRVPEGWRIVADNNSYPVPEPQPAPGPAKRAH